MKPTRSHFAAFYIPQQFIIVAGGSTGKGLQQRDIPTVGALLFHLCFCAVLCCAVLCCAVLCCAVLCCAVLTLRFPSRGVRAVEDGDCQSLTGNNTSLVLPAGSSSAVQRVPVSYTHKCWS